MAQNQSVPPRPLQVVNTLVETEEKKGTYLLEPDASVTIYRFGESIKHNQDINFTFNQDPNWANIHYKIGDQIVLLVSRSTFDVTINFPDLIYYTQCGERNTSINLSTTYGRLALYLTWDGEYWVNSNDNC